MGHQQPEDNQVKDRPRALPAAFHDHLTKPTDAIVVQQRLAGTGQTPGLQE
jgi:hypothetical protein